MSVLNPKTSLLEKLARLATLVPGLIDYDTVERANCQEQAEGILRDPEVTEWLDNMAELQFCPPRRKYFIADVISPVPDLVPDDLFPVPTHEALTQAFNAAKEQHGEGDSLRVVIDTSEVKAVPINPEDEKPPFGEDPRVKFKVVSGPAGPFPITQQQIDYAGPESDYVEKRLKQIIITGPQVGYELCCIDPKTITPDFEGGVCTYMEAGSVEEALLDCLDAFPRKLGFKDHFVRNVDTHEEFDFNGPRTEVSGEEQVEGLSLDLDESGSLPEGETGLSLDEESEVPGLGLDED